MTNPLVEHLREGADAAGGGPFVRVRQLIRLDYWKRQRLRMRQRPVVRVCLGLVAAFVCGIAIGVGVAAMIAPAPVAYTVAGGESTPGEGVAKGGEPVVAVSVRKESHAVARRPLSLVDIDPISHAAAASTLPPMPTHVPPKVRTDKVSYPPSASAPLASRDAEAPVAAVTASVPPVGDGGGADETPAAAIPAPAIVDKGASEHTPAPDRPFTGADGTSAPPAGVDGTPAKQGMMARATEQAPASNISFEGARSVAEAARAEAVPRAHVALGPLLLKTEPAGPPQASSTPPEPSENAGIVDDVAPPPHPPEKNLQLAALPMLHTDTWIRNAVAVPDKPRDAMIAMIIDDMGIDQKRSKAIIRLPAPLTLAFIPYGYHLHELVAAARAAGHEIMLHQPMEPIDPDADPGPNALRTTVSIEENRRRLQWSFSRLDGIVGVNNHMGSRFTAWEEGMDMVMNEVDKRGLLFVDSITSNESVAFRVAREHKLPSAHRDVFIDHDISPEAIENSLSEIERIARRRGYAVAIAHPHDLTREALARWIVDARSRGFDFVPISYIVRRSMKSG